MTTTVKIEAHCSNEKEVKVCVFDDEDKLAEKFILQDGEKAERFVYDDRMISVRERLIDDVSTQARFSIGDRVRKVGGSYQAVGTIKATFLADDGSPRYVFRFDTPAGLLHIFGENQLAPIGDGER